MDKKIADDPELERRALAAYYRTAGADGVVADAPSTASGVVEHDGKLYVVLANASRTLAVYRVENTGPLRRMKRWPREVAERD